MVHYQIYARKERDPWFESDKSAKLILLPNYLPLTTCSSPQMLYRTIALEIFRKVLGNTLCRIHLKKSASLVKKAHFLAGFLEISETTTPYNTPNDS